jgi:predicted RNA-binding Zn-ribbon protein involved in translation (DUF1610 family)
MSNYSRYKSRHTHSIDTSLLVTIIGFVLTFMLILAHSACTAKEWNDGYCLNCNTRYELRSVDEGVHYYACPDCGNEVKKFGGR